jgi:hypothetical protein
LFTEFKNGGLFAKRSEKITAIIDNSQMILTSLAREVHCMLVLLPGERSQVT